MQTGTHKILCCKHGGSRVTLSLWPFCGRIPGPTDTIWASFKYLCNGLHAYIVVYKVIQGYTWVYKGIHGYIGVYVGIQRFIRVYVDI